MYDEMKARGVAMVFSGHWARPQCLVPVLKISKPNMSDAKEIMHICRIQLFLAQNMGCLATEFQVFILF